MDAGQFKKDDTPPLLTALERFDEIFAVLKDDDALKIHGIVEWAKEEGRQISKELMETVGVQQLPDADIENKVAEMEAARRSRNYKVSDAIRAELGGLGIVVEITKDGARWKRK
jgi:cysteinyl-tRNA synthetase